MKRLEDWVAVYFRESERAEAMRALAGYGTEPWHSEPERVKRDIVIVSRGSMDKLRRTIELAKTDYRDVLVGEDVDPWVIDEIRKHEDPNFRRPRV